MRKAARMRTSTSSRNTVSAYIADAPAPARKMLRELRAAIRSAAPGAEEMISYRMPYYSYHGRLIYFAGYRHHIGVYVMGAARKAYARELQKYQTSKATLHFPIGSPLPLGLVKKLVRHQARENRRAAAARR